MQAREVAGMMRQIRGAPVTILITMMMLARSTGTQELTRCTGYNDGTVTEALRDLEFLGLVQNHRRYNGWMLTAKARQLPLVQQSLPEPEELEDEGVIDVMQDPDVDREPEKIRVGSSSLHDHDLFDPSSEETTTNKQDSDRELEKIGVGVEIDAEATQAVAELCGSGVPKRTRNGKGALDAVEAAVGGGWTGDRVLREVRGWLAYCDSKAGSSIKSPGVLTACRILDLQPAPETLPMSREEQARSYIEQQYERIVRR